MHYSSAMKINKITLELSLSTYMSLLSMAALFVSMTSIGLTVSHGQVLFQYNCQINDLTLHANLFKLLVFCSVINQNCKLLWRLNHKQT